MKNLLFIGIFLLLTGCASIDKIEISPDKCVVEGVRTWGKTAQSIDLCGSTIRKTENDQLTEAIVERLLGS